MNTTTAPTLQDVIARMEASGYTYALRNGRLTESASKTFSYDFVSVNGPSDQHGNPEPWILTRSIDVLASALRDGRSYEIDCEHQVVRYFNPDWSVYKSFAFDDLGQMCSDNQELLLDIADLRFYADMENN